MNTRNSEQLRNELSDMLGIPQQHVALDPDHRGSFTTNNITIEKWVWTSELGSRVTSLLYLPEGQKHKVPGVVMTNGHGGSKNTDYAQYTGQLYAKLGIACLLHDTIGEEERHIQGKMGTRAHDAKDVIEQTNAARRPILGKMIFDASRAIDFLSAHPKVDAERIGVAGNSLGGTIATWLAALDTRLKAVIISGSGLSKLNGSVCKPCCAIPSQRMECFCDYGQMLSLAAPHCAVLSMNGTLDTIVTQDRDDYWQQHHDNVNQCAAVYKSFGAAHRFKDWFQPDGGHRAYHLHKDAVEWFSKFLQLPYWTPEKIHQLPTITLEQWYAKFGITWPKNSAKLYWVDVHHKGGVFLNMDIAPIPKPELQCLYPSEMGGNEFTLAGWLERICL